MKQNNKTLLCLLAGLMLVVQIAPAITADNPYTLAITNRNLFALKAPVDPATLVVPPPPVNVPKVMLTGLTTLMGGKRCILRVPRAARPPEPAKEVSLFKAEGDPAEEGVQVLEIDLALARVKINNNGTEQTLDLSKDAPKSTAIPVPPGVGIPGVPRPVGVIPPPVAVPVVPAVSRQVRSPSGGPQQAVTGGGPAQAAAPTSDLPPVLSAEDQVIMMEAWRLRDKQKIAAGLMHPDDMPPYPPTELTEELEQNQGSGNPSGPPRLPGQ